MKYGVNFRVIGSDGRPIEDVRDAYPKLKPFVYKDGTGEIGWALLEDFTFEYRRKGDANAWRFVLKGDSNGDITKCFDYDGASRPNVTRAVAGDRMDKDVVVPSLGHDLGYTVHEYVTGFTKSDWDDFLTDSMDAYGAPNDKQLSFHLAVSFGGRRFWAKSEDELVHYRALVEITPVPIW